MAKKVTRIAKLQFMATQAKPGPELAGLGIDMPGFTRQFNDATKERAGEIVPVVITAYNDRSFDFVLKTAPTSFMIKKELKLEKGAANPLTDKVGTLTDEQLTKIAEYKMVDLNANNINAAKNIVAGTARNMGVLVEGYNFDKKENK